MNAETLHELMSLAVQAGALILTILVAVAADALKRKWGVEIEEKHREAFKQAIRSGAKAVIEGLPDGVGGAGSDLTVDQVVSATKGQVESYVRASVPDAIAALSPLPDVLDRQIVGVLGDLLAARRAGR